MAEKDFPELHAAIADHSLMEAAGLRTLLYYDRIISSESKRDVPPDFLAELHRRITQKLITFAAATVIIASMAAGIIAALSPESVVEG